MRHPHRTPQTSPQRPHHLLVSHLPTTPARISSNLTFSEHPSYHPPPSPHSLLTSSKTPRKGALNDETLPPPDAHAPCLLLIAIRSRKAAVLRRNPNSPT